MLGRHKQLTLLGTAHRQARHRLLTRSEGLAAGQGRPRSAREPPPLSDRRRGQNLSTGLSGGPKNFQGGSDHPCLLEPTPVRPGDRFAISLAGKALVRASGPAVDSAGTYSATAAGQGTPLSPPTCSLGQSLRRLPADRSAWATFCCDRIRWLSPVLFAVPFSLFF